MTEPLSCRAVAAGLQALQSGALGAAEEAALRAHLADCAACRRRLEVDEAFLTLLRRALPRTPAPPGLESRVRAALERASPGRASVPWFARPAFLVGATAVLLAALLVPLLPGRLGGLGDGVPVDEALLVVDDECDREGLPLDLQRECTHPYHVNALRRRGSERWLVSPEDANAARLLLDRGLRGYRVRVQGQLGGIL